jgi:hypothetical protein
VAAVDEGSLVVEYGAGERGLLVAVRLRGAGAVRAASGRDRAWRVVLTTEDPGFAPGPQPPSIEREGDGLVLVFSRPGAVVLRASGRGVDPAAGEDQVSWSGAERCD